MRFLVRLTACAALIVLPLLAVITPTRLQATPAEVAVPGEVPKPTERPNPAAVDKVEAVAKKEGLPPPTKSLDSYDPVHVLKASVRTLGILFVLAILIESALAVIFNWRLYLTLFYGRGVKTLAMIVVAGLVVWTFQIDIINALMRDYGYRESGPNPDLLSGLLTALILAGGSSGVNRMLVALGYRDVKRPEEVQRRPEKTQAWVAVQTKRDKAVGPISVNITEDTTVGGAPVRDLVGIISEVSLRERLRAVFFLDERRFPQAGGYPVKAGTRYRLDVTAKDDAHNDILGDISGVYIFAGGAIIDFKTTL